MLQPKEGLLQETRMCVAFRRIIPREAPEAIEPDALEALPGWTEFAQITTDELWERNYHSRLDNIRYQAALDEENEEFYGRQSESL